MIIACDVDLVVVDLVDKWVEYINDGIYENIRPDGKSENNVPYMIKEDLFGLYDFSQNSVIAKTLSKEEVMSFWKKRNLYDGVLPMTDSVETLQYLHNKGADIVFASHVEGDHSKSKYEFLEKHFPFMSGFLATREKKYCRCDVFVDDRLNHLKAVKDLDSGVLTVKMYTDFEDKNVYSDYFVPDLQIKDWTSLKNTINIFK